MKAVMQKGTGSLLAEHPTPEPGPNDLLVRVRAASFNRADLAMFLGRTHGPVGGPGTILGLEWAGEVEAVGTEVTSFHAGDRVMCSGSGGFAEHAVTNWRKVFPMPAGMSFEEAACLPIALRTMHDAIVTNGGLRPGQTILIQGASSAVGLMGLQIAREMGAALVIGTSTNPDRRGRLGEFGAGLSLDSKDPAWVEQVLQATGGRGVDLVVDQLSGPLANQNLAATAITGTIVNVGRMAGQQAEFDFELHAYRRIRYIGVTFRTRSVEEVHEIGRLVTRDLWPALIAGRLRVPVDRSFPLDAVEEARELMTANKHFGKLVLVP